VLKDYSDEEEQRAMEGITVDRVWEMVAKRWMELNSNVT
jgi:hypothetical protein